MRGDVTRGTVPEVTGGDGDHGGWRGLLAVLLVAGLSGGAAADEVSPLERYPGRLVVVGDHALHIDCSGRAAPGQPVVVLESGIGGFSLEWHAVKAAVARHHRVCAYDRAGYGWSDPAPGPRSAARSAGELAALLEAAGEAPPYVLAGHSYGGLVVREFAARYAAQVAGLVLVDAATPAQFERLPAAVLPRTWAAALASGARVHSMPRPADSFPPALSTLGLQLMMLPKARAAYAAEIRGFEDSARHLAGLAPAALTVPLIVVTRGRGEFDEGAGGDAAERTWRELQGALRSVSLQATQWIADGAGHRVHAERPELVARALELVSAGGPTFAAADARAAARPGGAGVRPPLALVSAARARF
ncbi:MAG: alpha/beta hydrolase [Gammaproteobacteria bacterium]|nr:alpha/beta hydrolase [Gammaproteobacteria bacterium]